MDSGICTDFSWHYQNRTWKYYENYLRRFSNSPQRILDIGSGLGLFLECCRENNVDCVGLELSEPALKMTREKGLNVVAHDICRPFDTLEDESFDAVFSFQVIEHLRRPAQINTIKESFRVLKKGGQMQVDSPCRFFHQAQLAPTHIGLLAPKELKAMAVEAGFSRVNMGYNFPQEFEDLPKEVVTELWKKYQPDILSQTATILAYKD